MFLQRDRCDFSHELKITGCGTVWVLIFFSLPFLLLLLLILSFLLINSAPTDILGKKENRRENLLKGKKTNSKEI